MTPSYRRASLPAFRHIHKLIARKTERRHMEERESGKNRREGGGNKRMTISEI